MLSSWDSGSPRGLRSLKEFAQYRQCKPVWCHFGSAPPLSAKMGTHIQSYHQGLQLYLSFPFSDVISLTQSDKG